MYLFRNRFWRGREVIRFGLWAIAVAVSGRVIAQEVAAPAKGDFENRIYIGQPDGSGMKPLVEMGEYRTQVQPTWSQDGKRIVFAAWRAAKGEKETDAKIVVANADGSDPKILGDGHYPSFSPRHQRIAIFRYQPNYGVWVMSSEGPEKELVLLDTNGGAARWSPDGRQIAYTTKRNNELNLFVFDLIEGEEVALFEEGKSPYINFFRNIAWSHDGRQIVLKGQRAGSRTVEIAIVDARGAKHGHTVRYEGPSLYNVSWNHDSSRIFFAHETGTRGNRVQLYSMDANDNSPPELLPGQDANRANNAAAISPDGKQLLIVSRTPPPMNNPAKDKAKKAN